MTPFFKSFALLFFLLSASRLHAGESKAKLPALPGADAAVEIPAQEWPLRPGPRKIRVLIHYPGGKLRNVNKDTGLMLTLHNWGGTDCAGTANPRVLAEKLNVVALCVNYLQSGPKDSIEGPEPYDFGYLQALDALRALHYVFDGLRSSDTPFATGRIFCTGGSGGGNVTLMANKLAPRTFTCVVDMCGMPKLSDDIAFNLPGGSGLNARWSRDRKNPNFLSPDHQEMRFVGNPDHLATMKRLGSTAKIVVVHGVDDATCPFADAREMVAWMKLVGMDVEPHFITKEQLDGKVFTSSGHALGDRTAIVLKVAGAYLEPDGAKAIVRKGETDFERRDEIRYRTSHGEFVISYDEGFPVGSFVAASPPVAYPDPTDVLQVRGRDGKMSKVKSIEDWARRREHIRANLEAVMGPLPGPMWRVVPEVKLIEEVRVGALTRRKILYRSDAEHWVPAYVLLPQLKPGAKRPAVLCLHQTTPFGKDETAGVRGNADLRYALELAQMGFVTMAPDYPSFGEHKFDFDGKHGYVSGSIKAVWDNMRAIDVLETLPEVDAARIGCIGHSLGGHNGMFTAVFEPRIRALVSSCGFSSMRRDDLPSWTGKVYMPRIKSEFDNDIRKLPFDFHEIVASFAPRAFLACAADKDNDFDVRGVREVMEAAKAVYRLHGVENRLEAYYPAGKHAFPLDARKKAYTFLAKHLETNP